MKLFLLKDEDADWDDWHGFVIAAGSETEAREIACGEVLGYRKELWLTEKTTCSLLAEEAIGFTDAGVVLWDYHSG